jgi:hypothetical protein
MKAALQIAICLSVLALIGASCGLAMMLSGYVMIGAFQTIPGTPRVSGLNRELLLWMILVGTSLGGTIALLVAYHRYKRMS